MLLNLRQSVQTAGGVLRIVSFAASGWLSFSTPAKMAANQGGSRMSCLKLHWPQTFSLYQPVESEWADESGASDAPVILSFPRIAGRIGRGRQSELLSRARLIFENRCCPECSRAAVVPVDSEPLLMSGNHMPVPGTGRLVGFECAHCGHAWAADE